METFEIKVNKNLISRIAIETVQALTPIKGAIYLNFKNRHINMKSILGVLSAGVKEGDIIEVAVENPVETKNVKKILIDRLM